MTTRTHVSSTPRVSVLMPAYNAAPFLHQAVESILTQTFTDFEFIIIDDGSTDATPTILAEYTDPRIRVVRKARNEGLVSALNLGIEMARGKYLARMDADDISLPERFERQIAALDHLPDIAILGTKAIRIDTSGQFIEHMVSVTKPSAIRRRLEAGVAPIVHPSVMMRTQFVRELGGYRMGFPQAQDRDLWLRAVGRAQICNLNEVLLLHRTNPDGVRLSHVIEGCHSAMYALDCYHRRAAGKEERTKTEFLASVHLTPYEVRALWAGALRLLTIGELEKTKVLLTEVLKGNPNHYGARFLMRALTGPLGQATAVAYRCYRRARGLIVHSLLGALASDLKHWPSLNRWLRQD